MLTILRWRPRTTTRSTIIRVEWGGVNVHMKGNSVIAVTGES